MQGLSESRFNMWRAVIVMAHADSVVKPHEIHFILESTKDIAMTEEQRTTLARDFKDPSSMQTVFDKITSPRDKEDFFHFARAICWSDGTVDEAEKSLLDHLTMLTMRGEDKTAMKAALSDFDGVFVDGTQQANDQNFFAFVKGLMRTKAA